MKELVILVYILLVVNAVSDHHKWIKFKVQNDKIYKTTEEEAARFEVFQSNLKTIEAHNMRYQEGEETYEMDVTRFADLTQDEIVRKWSMPHIANDQIHNVFETQTGITGAKAVDWRDRGAVLKVHDQGNCGSCWAFSAVGSLEGQNAIKHNESTLLSVQELVDCADRYDGCEGGWMYDAFNYVQRSGISKQAHYEYNGKDGTCKSANISRVALEVKGYTRIEKSEEALRQAVENIGPISVTLYQGWLTFYKKGIFQHDYCPTDNPAHAVLAVGYGSENGTDFWIMKNSWGKHWGEDGYFRIVRNKNNMCGLASYAMYPNVV